MCSAQPRQVVLGGLRKQAEQVMGEDASREYSSVVSEESHLQAPALASLDGLECGSVS